MKTYKLCLLGVLTLPIILFAQNPLAIPDTLSGSAINLTIKDSSRTWYAGYSTNTIGLNTSYLGPTLILQKGTLTQFNVQNLLADTTTIHWHGLHLAPSNDGGPHTTIAPSSIWTPSFPIMDQAGTYWYHSHLHNKTVEQVTKGEAGLIIIRDSIEATINLPRKYNVDDFPIIIQTKCFDSNKQLAVNTAGDSVIMVNGTLSPYLQVPAQVIRLRLLNASINRIFKLGLHNNQNIIQIGSDGGLLSQPVSLSRLQLAPGERAEVLLDLTGMQGQQININSYSSELANGIYGAANPSAMGPGVIPGYASNPLNGINFKILQLNITTPTSNPITSIPTNLVPVNPLPASSANLTFPISISPQAMGPNGMLNGPFQLNNQLFNMQTINHTTTLGSTEIWSITNNTAIAHPFHVHGLQFYVLDRNGFAPPVNEQGRKDVIMVYAQETIKIIMQFEDFTDNVIPFMYHCHMLTHEEDGMMAQYLVLNATGIDDSNMAYNAVLIFPNPCSANVNVHSKSEILRTEIVDVLGRIIYSSNEKYTFKNIDLPETPSGLYVIKTFGKNSSTTHRIVIQ